MKGDHINNARRKRLDIDLRWIRESFLASAAHDLKQPVNALGIYAEWLASVEIDLCVAFVRGERSGKRL